MSRTAAMARWHLAPKHTRAEFFRELARQEIIEHSRWMNECLGLNRDLRVQAYQEEAIAAFVDEVLIAGRSDASAIDQTVRLVLSVDGAARGTIPNALLYRHACCPRIRAALLKEAWVSGKAGSPLVLTGPGVRTLTDYFREADASVLMDDGESARLSDLRAASDTVTLYRGAKMLPEGMKATARRMSWTRDIRVAEWFARHGSGRGESVVLQAEYPTAQILALWEESAREPEVVVDPYRLREIRMAA